MKRLLLVFCCVLLVACNNTGSGSGSNDQSTEPEVVVESLPLLEDTKKIQAYLQTVEGFTYTENYSQEEINLHQDDSNELFITNESGQVLILSVENEMYVSTFTEIDSDEYSSCEIVDDYILVHHNKDNILTMDIYYISDEGIFQVTEKSILISGTKIVDPYINTTEVITSTIEHEDSWRKFTIHTTSIYTDERQQTHDLMDISTLYFLDKINKKYNLTEDNQSQANSALTFQNALKNYGENSELKTFEQVFKAEDLKGAILYYDLNRDGFKAGDKEAFANQIVEKLHDIVNQLNNQSKNAFDYITVSDEGIFFARNNGQVEPKLQSVMAYYETLPIVDGAYGEVFYQFGFQEDLALPIYHAILDTDMLVDKGSIKAWLVMLKGYEAFASSSIPAPNVLISADEDLKQFEGGRKVNLVKKLNLLNEPITLTNLKSLKLKNSIGNSKVSYLETNADAFNINMMGDESFVGLLSYSTIDSAYYIDMIQLPVANFYYEFSDETVYFNYLSGLVRVMTYKEEPIDIFSEDLLKRIHDGETIKVNGFIQYWFSNKEEEWLDGKPIVPAVEVKEIWEVEE
ncbi:MAG: hypothetical protein JXR88_00630 [Clostridia bacterium]|nr:hypothetical protein [Clostridia bacterium]